MSEAPVLDKLLASIDWYRSLVDRESAWQVMRETKPARWTAEDEALLRGMQSQRAQARADIIRYGKELWGA